MAESAAPIVYQLRVVLCGISPLIWHRLLVRADSTVADLHHTLQIALGWTDSHLHRFGIHGKAHGVAHAGGLTFADDPTQVRLASFAFRPRERFAYQYDFGADWQHDLRVEQCLALDPDGRYPVCIGGGRAAPPEDCGGPWAYLDLRQQHSVFALAERLTALVDSGMIDDDREELLDVLRWLAVDRFDRGQVNQRLQHYAADDDRWRANP